MSRVNSRCCSPGDELTQGVVITYVDDLLLTGWQYYIDAITKVLLMKYVMKRSGSLPYDEQGEKMTGSESEGIDFLGRRSPVMLMELSGVISPTISSIV